jgi:TonB family protein
MSGRNYNFDGAVTLDALVNKDGSVREVHVVQSSGIQELDRNASFTLTKTVFSALPNLDADAYVFRTVMRFKKDEHGARPTFTGQLKENDLN